MSRAAAIAQAATIDAHVAVMVACLALPALLMILLAIDAVRIQLRRPRADRPVPEEANRP